MCGIFGALIVERNANLNLAVLEELAVINEERGHHAFGFASTDNRIVRTFKSAGRPSDLKDKIAELILPRATAFVAHTRWATHGDPSKNINNHPHRVNALANPKDSEGVIVHNGVVSNHTRLVNRYSLRMKSECDSEVIARLFSSRRLFENTGSGRLSTLKRARLTAEAMDCPSAFLFMGPTRYAAVRMGRPLWWHKFESVVYFSSIPLDFETDYARGSIVDNAVRTYNWSSTEGRWKLVGRCDIERGTRKGGVKHAISELDRDWRKTTLGSASDSELNNALERHRDSFKRRQKQNLGLTRRQVDKLLEQRESNYVPSQGPVPKWKQIANDLKNEPKKG